ncbi:LysR substrate-binding domain-containing protein [Pseudoxanthomonas sp. UTMC 1351]|uniref:LysR family transcriptional regulator n=1 Tax=Pseudoxanthomonas sp. UTMC 1351 TaxID=2695853 RepID=UPI0034CFD09F
MNNGLLEHIEAFVAIAESGSVTAASIAMGTTQATLSRQLAALEKHLGCRLLHRSTRAISLTQEGETYLQHALRMLELKRASESALQERGRLRGRLRIACSNGFGRKLLIPALRDWQKEHPQLSMELVLSDQLSQLIEDRVDVAFRMASLKDSNLIARPIGISRRIVVASPDYIRRDGRIKAPEDLPGHQCLIFTGTERPGVWDFKGPNGKVSVRVQGRLALSTVDALQDAVLAGLGVAVMPAWFWTRELLDGQVVQLLPDYRLADHTIHAVTAARQNAASKVRLFVDFVEERLKGFLG